MGHFWGDVNARVQRIRQGDSHIAQVTWSFVKLEYYPEALLDAVTLILASSSAKYDDKGLSNMLWALARWGPVPASNAMLEAVALELGPRAKV